MSFRDEVYELVSRLPAGKLATYGQLAALCGRPRASRIVGAALLHAPEGLPCHRVIYRDGTLCCDKALGARKFSSRCWRRRVFLFCRTEGPICGFASGRGPRQGLRAKTDSILLQSLLSSA